MWVFSKTGFVSAVQHRDKPDTLLVRARIKEDLEPLAEFAGAKIIETEDADYRFRCEVKKKTFSKWLSDQAESIDYTNFKNAVHDGTARDAAYMRVWSAMNSLQR
jgi:hypothetical protein